MPFIFHLGGTKKHIENSIRGIVRAARRRFQWIDIDLLITKADPNCRHCAPGTCRGHIVGCHWDRPLLRDDFYDPAHRISIRAMVRELTLDQVLRLKTRDGGFRIRTIDVLMHTCAIRKIGCYVEAKDDARFELDWPWQYMVALKRKYRCRFRARSIKDFPTPGAGVRRMRAARRNGVRTRLIRGH